MYETCTHTIIWCLFVCCCFCVLMMGSTPPPSSHVTNFRERVATNCTFSAAWESSVKDFCDKSGILCPVLHICSVRSVTCPTFHHFELMVENTTTISLPNECSEEPSIEGDTILLLLPQAVASGFAFEPDVVNTFLDDDFYPEIKAMVDSHYFAHADLAEYGRGKFCELQPIDWGRFTCEYFFRAKVFELFRLYRLGDQQIPRYDMAISEDTVASFARNYPMFVLGFPVPTPLRIMVPIPPFYFAKSKERLDREKRQRSK